MKLYALSVLFKVGEGKASRLVSTHELSSFGFFQKSRYNYLYHVEQPKMPNTLLFSSPFI